MSPIDYDALRGNAGGEPPDGLHNAYLMSARHVETSKGDRIVTDWQTFEDPRYYWTTWFNFDAGLKYTQEFLDALGADRSSITDDDILELELSKVTGLRYQVRTEAGAAWVNTTVEDVWSPEVEQRQADIPADVSDLPAGPPPGAGAPAPVGVGAQQSLDDDIPF